MIDKPRVLPYWFTRSRLNHEPVPTAGTRDAKSHAEPGLSTTHLPPHCGLTMCTREGVCDELVYASTSRYVYDHCLVTGSLNMSAFTRPVPLGPRM